MSNLVTGGGGFLGQYLVEKLRERGEPVRVLCRGEYPELQKLGVEIIRGDIRESKIVEQACQNISTVYHVAAIPGVWGSWEKYYSINTEGSRNVLHACQNQGVKKLIYTSSPSVIFDGQAHLEANESLPYPTNYLCHYPHTKAIAEREILEANGDHGVATCALRPHLVWGPRDQHLIPRLLQRADSGRLRIVGDGSNEISMTYVENAAAAHWQAAEKLSLDSTVAGQAYFINDPKPVNLWSWINELLVNVCKSPVHKKISAQAAYRIGGVLESVYTMLGRKSEPPMTRFVALQLSQSHTYSINKARQDFDFKPIVDYETSYQRLMDELKSVK
ncbi:NAD-dependent epimerase/dehydratase family protein [Rubinisphaera italica]|uniref:3 beta-hydroxysteroid dehydrogenase/Delta 5-->4-isomerase n=1 Tax=Rubinisphaera italica TaxID=2527969 RepID=A0A5C5XF43_9PLAN|nr:NAD-dependent epimerase/dehydratase family protein [Rubinisphaera italica]TWT61600.1 3 beta-hydroxysteroid dehydrogenase/Delta 5-->4-isomerase [Rubinisphaera italica]